MVWSVLEGLQTPPIVTTDFLYLRFIGDRRIQEKDFGRIQIDRVVELQKWADNIKAVKNQSDSQVKNERIKLAIVAANNHYAGFGPGSVNIFRSMVGLPEAKWQEREDGLEEEQYPAHDLKQRTLSDFLS